MPAGSAAAARAHSRKGGTKRRQVGGGPKQAEGGTKGEGKGVGKQATFGPAEESAPGGVAGNAWGEDGASSSERACTMLANKRTAMDGRFTEDEAVKQRIAASLTKEVYDVTCKYHTTGLWQKIARHTYFENSTLAVIVVNAIYIALDTDHNPAATVLQAAPIWQVAEHSFCLYFSFEWFVRFKAFKYKRDCLRDAWFVFDSALVFMMVMETWLMTAIMAALGGAGALGVLGNVTILRLFRLLRLTRMARLMRMIPELMILVKGMVAGMRSVFTVMFLLLVVMYMFAIAFTQLAMGTPAGETHFDTVGTSFFSLLIHGVFLDSLAFMCDTLEESSFFCLVLYFVFIVLSALTVMNMLIGVLCEVVSAVSDAENDGIVVNAVTEKLQQVLSRLDEDCNEYISKEEFMMILQDREAAQALNDVGVDPIGIVDFADYIFDKDCEGDQISFEDFMGLVLDLRGSNHVTVKDVVDLRKHILGAVDRMEAHLAKKLQHLSGGGGSPLGVPPVLAAGGQAAPDAAGPRPREEVRRLEEHVSHVEGVLDALAVEVRRLGERLPPPPPQQQQERPPTPVGPPGELQDPAEQFPTPSGNSAQAPGGQERSLVGIVPAGLPAALGTFATPLGSPRWQEEQQPPSPDYHCLPGIPRSHSTEEGLPEHQVLS